MPNASEDERHAAIFFAFNNAALLCPDIPPVSILSAISRGTILLGARHAARRSVIGRAAITTTGRLLAEGWKVHVIRLTVPFDSRNVPEDLDLRLLRSRDDRVIDGLNFAFNNLTLPDGSLTLQSGSLTLTGATILPAGVALNLFGGTLTNNGTLDVGGTFGLTGGAFGGTGSLTMSGGSLSLPAGNAVAWTNSGVLTNTGILNLADSTITNAIDNQGTINLGGGLTFTQAMTNTGTLNAQPGNALFTAGLTQQTGGNIVLNDGSLQGNVNLNAGSLSGRGTVNGNVVIGNAMLVPGFSPGTITINGNLTLSGGSVLNVELGGLTQGSGYDWINVLGTANLAGTLNVSSFGGFVPGAGTNFTIMNFNASTGAFAAVNLAQALNVTYAATPVSVTLSVPAPVVVAGDGPVVIVPVIVALERAVPEKLRADDVKALAPVTQAEDKREIEVEGCR